jgi:hypothetical protein
VTAESELKEAEEALCEAAGLIRAQESKIASMQRAGLNTSEAEALLLAYRTAIELATQRYTALHALTQKNRSAASDRKWARNFLGSFQLTLDPSPFLSCSALQIGEGLDNQGLLGCCAALGGGQSLADRCLLSLALAVRSGFPNDRLLTSADTTSFSHSFPTLRHSTYPTTVLHFTTVYTTEKYLDNPACSSPWYFGTAVCNLTCSRRYLRIPARLRKEVSAIAYLCNW